MGKYLVYFALMLINVPNGVLWYFGNLSAYTSSYFLYKFGPNVNTRYTTLASVFEMMYMIGFTVSGAVINRLSNQCTMLLGLLTFDCAVFVSYFCVKHSPETLVVTLGAMSGISIGICMGIAYNYIIQWASDGRLGLVSGLTTQTAAGAIGINQIITFYINPDNLKPDLKTDESRYFSQPEIIERVPSVFLVLGGVFVIFHLIGLSLLRNQDGGQIKILDIKDTQSDSTRSSGDETIRLIDQSQLYTSSNDCSKLKDHLKVNKTTPVKNKSNGIQHLPSSSCQVQDCKNDSFCNDNNQQEQFGQLMNSTTKKTVCENGGNLTKTDNSALSENEEKIFPENGSFKLWLLPLLKRKEFYALWILSGVSTVLIVIMVSSYKIFGFSVIQDDHFMAALGTSVTVFLVPGRILCGLVCDKIGSKQSFILIYTMGTILSAFIYFSIYLSKWLYFVVTCLLFTGINSLYGFYPVAIYYCFGHDNFCFIRGLTLTSSVIVNLISPFVIDGIVEYLGWFWLFWSVGFLQFLSVVVTIVMLPNGS